LPDDVSRVVSVHPKLYLKKQCRPGRKMGHLNLVDPSATMNLEDVIQKIKEGYQL
jgi:phosphoribosylaminoimidazole carboxylase (NCAIR synthetase)